MSHKTAKAIRNILRTTGRCDPREVSLRVTRTGYRFGGQRILAADCGRALYQQAKKAGGVAA